MSRWARPLPSAVPGNYHAYVYANGARPPTSRRSDLIAAAFSGLPSTLQVSIKQRSLRSAAVYVYDTTRAVGTLVPPGRPGFGRGVVVHLAISVLCGETLARTLPRNQSAAWGAAAGFLIGVINVGVIGRSFPAISRLPLVPELADNVMFGTVFALVLDRPDPQRGDRGGIAMENIQP